MRKYILSVLFICTALTVHITCKKEDRLVNPTENSLSVDQAQNWYNSQSKKASDSDVETDGKKNKLKAIKPIWTKALNTEDEKYYVVEVPLSVDDLGFSITSTRFNSTTTTTINGTTKLLVLKDKKDGTQFSILMHIYSDDGVKRDFPYGKPPKDFTGTIFYTDLQGKFLLGWKFENGKIAKKSTKSVDNDCATCLVVDDGTTTTTCDTYTTDWYERQCTEWSNSTYTCGEWQYIGSTSVTYCNTTSTGGGGYTGPKPADPVDCAGVQNGTAYIGTCGICIGGTTGFTSCKDPCVEKIVLALQADNATITNQNTQIFNQLPSTSNPTPPEYGTERNLKSATATGLNDYVNTLVRAGSTSSFTPKFTWNSIDGYTIGAAHSHPGETAPSPGDAVWSFGNLNNPSLTNQSDIDLYMQNVSVTAITKNETFIVTPRVWSELKVLYEEFHASNYIDANGDHKNYMNDRFRDLAQAYMRQHNATPATGTAYALMTIFGDAISLYRAPVGSNSFSKLELTNGQVAEDPCIDNSTPTVV